MKDDKKKSKSPFSDLAPFYSLMYEIEYINDKSRPFKIFCIVMAILSLIPLTIGIFTKAFALIITAAFLIFVIGVYYLMNNIAFKHVKFKTGRGAVILIIMFYFLVMTEAVIFLKYPSLTGDSLTNGFFDDFSEEEFFEENLQSDEAEEANESANEYLPINEQYQYASRSGDGSVYIVDPREDGQFIVEHWEVDSAASDRTKKKSEIGMYTANNANLEMNWIDEDQLAFTLRIQDTELEEARLFTADATNKKVNQGSSYTEDICNYIFQKENKFLYRAIPLNEHFMKIEAWDQEGTYLYSCCVVNMDKHEQDFTWNDDNHKSFTMNIQDPMRPETQEEKDACRFDITEDFIMYDSLKEYLDVNPIHEER